MSPRVVLLTAPDDVTADQLARTLVEERLCACVNILPGLRSVYRWQGALEEAREVLLIGKTMEARVPDVVARVAALHPYAVPEVIALPIEGGLAPYLAWIAAECAAADPIS